MKRVAHFFDVRECPDLTALCGSFSTKQLQSPTRSTVPLIDLVYGGGSAWERFLRRLGAPADCAVAFELGVPSPKPKGNPSQTDAVFASSANVWAVEAKWTEPVDRQTVAQRISKPESDGGDPRLTVAGWLAHLQPHCRRSLCVDDFSDIIYQMVHRAASAAYLGHQRKLNPELVYLHFAPSPDRASASTEHYLRELERFHERLGKPSTLPFRVVEMPLSFNDAFKAIRGLDKRSPATAAHVKRALCAGALFTFGEPVMVSIGSVSSGCGPDLVPAP
ncbi:hypothetical protein [Opitutus terrae]|uniref:Uncharacterized protein n=1 Tax=Opitutus terrae (strain DSM 11246 / JCM 15787 / PB90-1) TaxID=452637 RepID=B1ZYW7_OPITP|nr:hypothetical protein [Opitutus terrae]ACB76290.1 hypothetical protein Oter_3009 [Opitutus terrae PB90-1]